MLNVLLCNIVLFMLMFSFLFCDRMCFVSGSESVDVFYRLYIYLLSLNIHLSKGEWGCHSQFNPVDFWYRNQTRTLISNVICRDSHFYISWGERSLFVLLIFVEFVTQNCLSFLLVIHQWCFMVKGEAFFSSFPY